MTLDYHDWTENEARSQARAERIEADRRYGGEAFLFNGQPMLERWHITDNGTVLSQDGRVVAVLVVDVDVKDIPEAQERFNRNGRLIVAAPDLLRLIRRLADDWNACSEVMPGTVKAARELLAECEGAV